jgi:curved DNA-binding protein CbpA
MDSVADIKKVWKKLIKQYHPDQNIGQSEAERRAKEKKLQAVNKAYEVLKNPLSRSKFDREWRSRQHGTQGSSGQPNRAKAQTAQPRGQARPSSGAGAAPKTAQAKAQAPPQSTSSPHTSSGTQSQTKQQSGATGGWYDIGGWRNTSQDKSQHRAHTQKAKAQAPPKSAGSQTPPSTQAPPQPSSSSRPSSPPPTQAPSAAASRYAAAKQHAYTTNQSKTPASRPSSSRSYHQSHPYWWKVLLFVHRAAFWVSFPGILYALIGLISVPQPPPPYPSVPYPVENLIVFLPILIACVARVGYQIYSKLRTFPLA